MTHVLAVDPGERIGVAKATKDGEFQANFVCNSEELFEYLLMLSENGQHPRTIVIEDYRLRRGKQMAQTGSRLIAPQIIGALRFYAYSVGALVVLQSPTILDIAAMHAGKKVYKGHYPDDLSAYLHLWYYLETIGVLKPKVSL